MVNDRDDAERREGGESASAGSAMDEQARGQGTAEPCGQIPARLEAIERAVQKISEQLSQLERAQQSQEFSLPHLLGAIVQVLAIAFMLAAMLSLLKTQADYRLATLSLLAAIATQLLAMTLFGSVRKG